MKKVLIFVILISTSRISFSQSLSRNEFVELANRLDSFVSKIDSVYDAKRSSQFIYLLANVNSNGTIDKFDLSGIKSDTIYQILNDLKPADLGDWKCVKCKEKTIVIPLFYVASNKKTDIVQQMFIAHYSKIPHKDMITEVGNTILVRYMSIATRQKPFEETPPNKFKKIEKDSKKEE